jgi:hypothetical protein
LKALIADSQRIKHKLRASAKLMQDAPF